MDGFKIGVDHALGKGFAYCSVIVDGKILDAWEISYREGVMEKYRETENLREVAEALRNRISVDAISRCVPTTVYLDTLGVVRWSGGEIVQTLPGRVFRIEIPRQVAPEGWRVLEPGDAQLWGDRLYETCGEKKGEWVLTDRTRSGDAQDARYWYARKLPEKPKQWTGPTREITAEELPKLRESAEKIIASNDGKCPGVKCELCPGGRKYNDGASCIANGFGPWYAIIENCKRFLAEHPLPEEKPKQWTGVTREITAEELPKLRESAEKIIEQDGSCYGVGCDYCPGLSIRNDGADCYRNGWRIANGCKPQALCLENCKRFLAEHPLPEEKPKMRRVELFRDGAGLLRYRAPSSIGIWPHAEAPSVKGFCGYVYEGHEDTPRTDAAMFEDKHGHLYRYASIEQIESGEAWMVFPVAFWVREEGNAND